MDGIREGDGTVVDEGDLPDAPSHQVARYVATKSTGSEQETGCTLDGVEVKAWGDAPLHQLEIQVHSLVREALRVNVLG